MKRYDICEFCEFGIDNGDDTYGCDQGFDLEYEDISVTGCPEFIKAGEK